jgi:hypothetical protein
MLNSQEILKHEDTYQAPDSGLYFQERDDDPLLPGSERQLLISSSRSMTDVKYPFFFFFFFFFFWYISLLELIICIL